jgi:hypothetical protein
MSTHSKVLLGRLKSPAGQKSCSMPKVMAAQMASPLPDGAPSGPGSERGGSRVGRTPRSAERRPRQSNGSKPSIRSACNFLLAFALLPPLTAFAQQNQLITTSFVVLGEGLGAGMADFALRDIYQTNTFGALIAQQLGTGFAQPLMELPGIGSAPGFPALAVNLPSLGQQTVRETFPPDLFVFNLSVPGLKVADALTKLPVRPLIQKNDGAQTMLNMILGYPALTFTNVPLWTQVQYAQALNPTLAVVELGYYDVLDAAVNGDPTRLPTVSTFQTNYAAIVSALRSLYANVVAMTIPSPFDTAYFTSLPSATQLVGASPANLQALYGFQSTDLLTVPGLMAVGSQLYGDTPGVLPAHSTIGAATAAQIISAVSSMNSAINTVAQQQGAIVYDLNALFASVKASGVTVGATTLTGNYLGGFYSLDGYYPGTTAHVLIANGVISLLNKTFGTSYATLNPSALLANDPAYRLTQSAKRNGPGLARTR